MSDDEWMRLPIGEPARRALRNAGYTQLIEVQHASRKEVADLHGMGPKGLRILEAELASRGMTFRTD